MSDTVAIFKRRDWLVWWVMNAAVKFASPEYRRHIHAAFDDYMGSSDWRAA